MRRDIEYRKQRLNRLYETASMIVIKYGGTGLEFSNFTDEHILEFWKYDDPFPRRNSFLNDVRAKTIKWLIRNKIQWKDDIWNGDFLQGMATHGMIKWNKVHFPSLFYTNENITNLIKVCPFGGTLKKKGWYFVPALYLSYSDQTASYLAGVLSCANIVEKDGFSYAKMNLNIKHWIDMAGIPMEFVGEDYFLISPIWGAIFTLKMPEAVRSRWLNIKKPYGTDFYAPILWKTYVGNSFPKNTLPYMKSQRMIYYDFEKLEGEEGKILKKIEKARVDRRLTMLSNAVREVVKMWGSKHETELEQCKKTA